MTSLQLYMLLKLDSVIGFFTGLTVVLVLFTLISWIAYGLNMAEGGGSATKKYGAFIKGFTPWAIVMALLFTLVSVFTPTTQQAAVMVVVPKIVNAISSDKELMALPGDIVSLASAWVKELRPENIKAGAKTVVQQAKECKPVKQ
jgi:hypothetical protein